MKQVVLIADDFGLNEVVNRAILRAHQNGALTGASLMVGQVGSEHAVELARANPTLQIGWHLHLCDSRPVTRARWPWGNSPVRAGCSLGASAASRQLSAEEIAAQWQLFRATNLRLHFVNAHHHLHVHPFVLRALHDILPAKFDGWLRGFDVRLLGIPTSGDALLAKLASPLARRALAQSGFRTSQSLWGLDRLFGMQASEVAAAVERLPKGLHEFIFHPRAVEGDADLDALIALRTLLPTLLPTSLPSPQRAA